MQIMIDISEKVAAKAQADGISVEAFVQRVVEQAAHPNPKGDVEWDWIGPGPRTPEEAGRDMLELSKGLTLGGLKIKDLIHEGHRY